MKPSPVSLIICAYNEQKTVAKVVSSCRRFNPTAQIIVVNDGSIDLTDQILTKLNKKIKFDYYKFPKNQGKSVAMVYGVKKAKYPIILFFDADLSNIKSIHFKKLLDPIHKNQADMVLGQPTETLIDYQLNPFKSFSGQRAVRKIDLLPILSDIKHIKFGIETYLNLYYKSQGKTIKYVSLNGMAHPTKYHKTNPLSATKEFINEGQQIASVYFKNYHFILKQVEHSFYHSKNKIKKIFTD